MAKRERPILFSGPMVRAILEGRKTQTRRVVKPQPGDHPNDEGHVMYRCPYGLPGDRLWVKETFALISGPEADCPLKGIGAENAPDRIWYRADGNKVPSRWSPSIHMPRWASRLTLEVVAVRVDRLQAISEEDARAEGYADHAVFLAGEWAKSLEGNPWVWVVEFKRVDAKGGGGGEA